MKTKQIVTATLLSAGLIIGTASPVFATDSKPVVITTVTSASYQAQLANYKIVLAVYDTATVTFKAQAVAFAAAVKTYKTSYELALSTYKAVLKANFPATTSAQYAVVLAAYNTALTAYNSATITFKAQLATYETALQNYKAAYALAVTSYKATIKMRENVRKAINVAFETSIHSANETFAKATAVAVTADQKLAATNARQVAVATANAVRKSALDAVGSKPVKPVMKIRVSDREESFKVDRPVKPAKPIKSNKH